MAGLCTSLGGVVTGLIMWAVALTVFAGVVFAIKYFGKKDEATPVEIQEEKVEVQE